MSKTKEAFQKYWKFYWPLSFMGITLIAGNLARNYVLLGFSRGVLELAWFALAQSIVNPFRASLALTPQMVTVKGDTRERSYRCLHFLLVVATGLSLIPMLIAILPPGQNILASLFNLSDEGTQRISYYLFWISPRLVLGALRQWGNGMLVRGKKTGWMSLLKALDLSLVIAWLALGLWLKLAIKHVMILSVWGTQLISICVLLAVLIKLRHSLPIATGKRPEPKTEVWRYRELWQYFWPLGLTASLFTFSRPIIYFFASRFHPEDISGELMISALNLAFSFGLLFQSTVNQLRFLIVRFGHKNPVQVARFMAVIATTVSLLMILTLCTSASEYYFRYLQNASGDLLILAREAAWGLCLGPLAIAWRNFFHGLAMIHNQTIYLLYGGIARNGSVLIMGQLLVMMHLFTPFWGAFLIVIAFTAEAMAVTLTSKSWRPDLVSAVS